MISRSCWTRARLLNSLARKVDSSSAFVGSERPLFLLGRTETGSGKTFANLSASGRSWLLLYWAKFSNAWGNSMPFFSKSDFRRVSASLAAAATSLRSKAGQIAVSKSATEVRSVVESPSEISRFCIFSLTQSILRGQAPTALNPEIMFAGRQPSWTALSKIIGVCHLVKVLGPTSLVSSCISKRSVFLVDLKQATSSTCSRWEVWLGMQTTSNLWSMKSCRALCDMACGP